MVCETVDDGWDWTLNLLFGANFPPSLKILFFSKTKDFNKIFYLLNCLCCNMCILGLLACDYIRQKVEYAIGKIKIEGV